MPVWGWILISIGGLLALAIVGLLVAYALSPEGREASRVKARMAANARRARRELYEDAYERTRRQLREEDRKRAHRDPGE